MSTVQVFLALWTQSESVTAGVDYRYAATSGNTYVCASTGTTASSGTGPTGTGTGISDGSATWNFVASGQNFIVPSNYGSIISVESVGGGGGGAYGSDGGAGGGGAYAKATSLSTSAGSTIAYAIGVGGAGGTSGAGGVSGGTTSFGSGPTISAPGGTGAATGLGTGGAGGSGGTGSTLYSGGAGGSGNGPPGAGGGGAGGLNGSGEAGTNYSSGSNGTAGGGADTTDGGAGGTAGSVSVGGSVPGAGGNGSEWASGRGSGGGGGGGATNNNSVSQIGGGGGLYGGGGGAGGRTNGVYNAGGAGGNGIIVFTYTSAGATLSWLPAAAASGLAAIAPQQPAPAAQGPIPGNVLSFLAPAPPSNPSSARPSQGAPTLAFVRLQANTLAYLPNPLAAVPSAPVAQQRSGAFGPVAPGYGPLPWIGAQPAAPAATPAPQQTGGGVLVRLQGNTLPYLPNGSPTIPVLASPQISGQSLAYVPPTASVSVVWLPLLPQAIAPRASAPQQIGGAAPQSYGVIAPTSWFPQIPQAGLPRPLAPMQAPAATGLPYVVALVSWLPSAGTTRPPGPAFTISSATSFVPYASTPLLWMPAPVIAQPSATLGPQLGPFVAFVPYTAAVASNWFPVLPVSNPLWPAATFLQGGSPVGWLSLPFVFPPLQFDAVPGRLFVIPSTRVSYTIPSTGVVYVIPE